MASIKNLDEVKVELYKLFNEAVDRHGSYEDPNSSGSSYPFGAKTQNRIAIGTLAQAIASVEREQREMKAEGFTASLPGKDR